MNPWGQVQPLRQVNPKTSSLESFRQRLASERISGRVAEFMQLTEDQVHYLIMNQPGKNVLAGVNTLKLIHIDQPYQLIKTK